MGVDGDDADGAFALQRAEPFHDAGRWQAEPRRAADFDRDEIAVLRLRGGAGRNSQFLAEHFLVDRLEPAAAIGRVSEDSEHALFRLVDDLDDAAAVADAVFFFGLLDAEQHAVANAGGFAGPRFARNVNADLRRSARALPRPIRRAWR